MDERDALAASPYKSRPGLKRLLPAARYAFKGVMAAWKHEAAFRQEVIIGLILALASVWLAPSVLFWALMNASLLLILCVEAINSAIEALADAISTESHPLLGRAKDLGSAAVLFVLLLTAVIWIVALWLRFGSVASAP